MIQPSTIAEKLLFSTVRIRTEREDGCIGTGTGFFFKFQVDERRVVPAIITNKHVIAGAVKGTLCIHEAEAGDTQPGRPTGRFFTIDIPQFEGLWILHPVADVDLCAILFLPFEVEAEQRGLRVYSVALDHTWIPTPEALAELDALEEILMIGYPNGLWDEVNNLPIFRRGVTATHPAIDYCGRSQGVIDAACFPGSSGSPVLIVNEGVFASPKKGNAILVGKRVMLLGVLFAGPQWTAEGKIVVREIPTVQQPVSLTPQMIHLGYMVKARELLRLGEHVIDTLRASGRLN